MASTGNITLAHHGLVAIEALNSAAQRGHITDEETVALRQWPGWGPLAPAFDPEPEGTWATIAERLDTTVTADEYDSARHCVDNSFYTSPQVMDHVIGLLTATGFAGGKVLEPGCGAGNFMRRPAAADWSWTGIEADIISARIAQALNPNAEIIHNRLEKTSLRDGSFDAAVGNVPFSNSGVWDAATGQRHNSLHAYFIARALQAVHDGGYVIAVTSRFLMDSPHEIAALTNEAALIAAVRLPSGTFHNQGTQVATDIVVLRKGDPDHSIRLTHHARPRIQPGPGAWQTVEVSPYWAARPTHVAGTMVATGNRHNPLAVVSENIPTDIDQAVEAAKADLIPYQAAIKTVPLVEPLPDNHHRDGSFVVIDDKICKIDNGAPIPVAKPSAELRALIGLRDLVVKLLALEADFDLPDDTIQPARSAALAAYQRYLAKYGPLNRGTLHEGNVDPDTGMPALVWRRPPMGGFRRDPAYVQVLAIERFDQETGQASPAPILLRRVNHRPVKIERVANPAEALAVSMGETGGINLDRIAGLLGLPSGDQGRRQATDALTGLVYHDPVLDQLVHARDYCSGNVRTKLAQARTAANQDPDRYTTNVHALEAVVPAELGPTEIDMRLGSPLLTEDDIESFCKEVIGARTVDVKRTEITATWEVTSWGASTAAKSTWGTVRFDAFKLVEYALNGRTPVVYDEIWDGTTNKKVRNAEQTLAAGEKMAEIEDRFSTWVWEETSRSRRICTEYNRRFNSHVVREADGSYLTFPGMSEDVNLWPWQRNMIDRIVSGETALCGHDVGLGKTKSMLGAAYQLRRFGLVTKPLIIVPNHLLEQIAREAQQTFPLGRYLIASKEDLAGTARRAFAARCATEDWDAVVMTHQAFTSLPVSPDTEQGYVTAQKANLDDYLRHHSPSKLGAKDIAKRLRRLDVRLAELRYDTRTDTDTILFEHLGIDWIAVDECHNFKRLDCNSGRADGFSFGASKRATDLHLKSETLKARRPGLPRLALFTGTPWSNTMAETFVWQTYLQPGRLAEAGVEHFDPWAATFVKRETKIEVAPDGSGFRVATRPTGLRNLPELRTMLSEVADILPADTVEVDRPDLEEHVEVVQQSDRLRIFVSTLVHRADRIRGGAVDRNEDNMLMVCNDGRKAALDPHLVGIAEHGAKLSKLVARVAAIHHENKDLRFGDSPTPGAFQVIFCDLGTPGGRNGSQTYGRIRAGLVNAGLPAEKVRWVHEATTDKAKAAMFASCRNGDIAVLLASTEKAGLGTNMQTRLLAIHHADAPWRPSDVNQRVGRGRRPGNLCPVVHDYRYVTEGTFDAYMWQTLERKARFIAQVFRADSTVREIEDIGDAVLSYTELKAAATGNPLVIEQAEAQAAVKRLRVIKAVDGQGVTAARRRAADQSEFAVNLRHRAGEAAKAASAVAAAGGQLTAEHHKSIAGLAESLHRRLSDPTGYWQTPAAYGPGIEIRASWMPDTKYVSVKVMHEHSYRTVETFDVPLRDIGRTVKAVTDNLTGLVGSFIASLPGLEDRLLRQADAAREDAASARHLVDTYVFPREAELREAERRLSEINIEIENLVNENNQLAEAG